MPPRVVTDPHAANTLSCPLPELRGLGVTTETSPLTRSGQSWMPFGFPLRARKTMAEGVGHQLFGSRSSRKRAGGIVVVVVDRNQAPLYQQALQ